MSAAGTVRTLKVRVRSLSLFDHQTLECLAKDGNASTAILARACGHAEAGTTRTLLRRLERWGLVEGLDGGFLGGRRWWTITEAGRKAIGGAA